MQTETTALVLLGSALVVQALRPLARRLWPYRIRIVRLGNGAGFSRVPRARRLYFALFGFCPCSGVVVGLLVAGALLLLAGKGAFDFSERDRFVTVNSVIIFLIIACATTWRWDDD